MAKKQQVMNKIVVLRLTEAEFEQFKAICSRKGSTVSGFLRQGIQNYIEKNRSL